MSAPRQRNVTIVFTVLLILLGFGAAHILHATETLRVGIVPFAIYSSEKVEYLQDIITTRLSEQLERHGHITVLPTPIAATGQTRRAFGTDELAQQAKSLGADYLIYGSLTMIEDELSIDARAFTMLPEEKTFRSFVVGTDFDRLITRIETRLADHLLTVATRLSSTKQTVIVEETLIEGPAEGEEIVEEAAIVETARIETNREPTADEAASDTVETAQASDSVPAPSAPPSMPKPAVATKKPDTAKPRATAATKSLNRLPGKITSNRMVADNAKRTVTFFGDVKATSEELLIFSDKMTVLYTNERDIDSITAQGNVKISQKDITASCQMAKFLHGDQKIVLTGKPKVWQGSNMVTGEMITILLDQDKIIVEGEGEERVNVTIYPEKKK